MSEESENEEAVQERRREITVKSEGITARLLKEADKDLKKKIDDAVGQFEQAISRAAWSNVVFEQGENRVSMQTNRAMKIIADAAFLKLKSEARESKVTAFLERFNRLSEEVEELSCYVER